MNCCLRIGKKQYGYLTNSNNYYQRLRVTEIISSEFDKIPEGIRNQLIISAADDLRPQQALGEVISKVTRIIIDNFDKLSVNIQNLLFKYIDDGYAIAFVAATISSNFDKIPEGIRNQLLP